MTARRKAAIMKETAAGACVRWPAAFCCKEREAGPVKARVVRRAPLALAYGCVNEEKLREVFAAMGVQVRVLQPEDCGTRLGVLAGEAGPAGRVGVPAPQHSVLVFAYFADALLDKALAALRTAQLGFDYKATLTPTNRMWTLPTLLEELQRERAQIEAQGRKP